MTKAQSSHYWPRIAYDPRIAAGWVRLINREFGLSLEITDYGSHDPEEVIDRETFDQRVASGEYITGPRNEEEQR